MLRKILMQMAKKKIAPTIKSVKPSIPKTEAAKKQAEHKIKMSKIPGEVYRKFKKSNEQIDKALTSVRQDLQKMKGEKPTKSGFSKGKDIKK